jgi:malyl-CoA/(S)-citramalyl-CoA lyase
MIPKVGNASDIYAVDALVTSIEAAMGRQKKIGFEVIIESAAGIAHVEEIAAASPRMQAMSLGAADFAASMGMQTTGIGGTQENYYMLHEGARHYSDPWHWAQAGHRVRLPDPWRAAGGRPVRRFLGRRGLPRAGAAVGHAGHGGQMGDPPQAGRAGQRGLHPVRGRRDRSARDPRRDGRGQGQRRGRDRLQGRLVDIASIKQAEVIVSQAEMIAGNVHVLILRWRGRLRPELHPAARIVI